MTQEERQLLLRDICMRLPHDVNVYCEWNYLDGERGNDSGILLDIDLFKDTILFKRSSGNCTRIPFNRIDGVVKPYLRPMSSMTVEEGERLEQIAKETLGDFMFEAEEDGGAIYHMDKWKTLSPAMFDYLNSIHIDYRGLIEKGLALEAPEEMYNFK